MPNKPGGNLMEPGVTPMTPRFKEIATAAAPVMWRKKDPSEIRKFPIFDQDGSGSCVAQTMKKLLGVYVWLKTGKYIALSASHIYQRRSNAPTSGMVGINAFEIGQEGTTLSEFAWDEGMSDQMMDAQLVNEFELEVSKAFKSGKPIVLPTCDIDTIASVIQQTGKGVMVWFYFIGSEWVARPKVLGLLDMNGSSALRHSVTAVDFTLTDDGKKALVIDDSWGPNAGNGAGQRIIDEDFFKARNWFAAYFMNFAYEEAGPLPPPVSEHKFTKDLVFIALLSTGEISEPTLNARQEDDVIALQDRLKAEGLFPTNIASTGYYGAVTRDAVGKYQVKYSITVPSNPGYGRVGPLTRNHLNSVGF